MRNKIPDLCIIVPCYNEEEVLQITSKLFLEKLESLISSKKVSESSYILFVNDGSKDNTWKVICNLAKENGHYKGICLSRNRGHQNALLAGLMEVKDNVDITISIDCDGQDDINAIDKMVDEYMGGVEIVYGVRNNRDVDSFFKRHSAEHFYSLMKHLGADIVYNHADFRLISSKVLKEFSNFKEVNIFLRGMFPLVGFKSTCVYYERKKRIAGKTHYPLRKMIGFAFDGITSLSEKPLHLITGFGIIVAFLSFIGVIWTIVSHFAGKTVQGWTSTTCIICFLGGIQLISVGIIGEYVGKIYMEVKNRPRYIISEKTGEQEDN